MKRLKALFKKQVSYQFAVRKMKLVSGKESLLPVMKGPGILQDWSPIIEIYGKYYALPGFKVEKEFTEQECQIHIQGMLSQLKEIEQIEVQETVYENVLNYTCYGFVQNQQSLFH